MAPMSEADTIILNKANIALAKSQRLIASWLPRGSAKEPPANAKSEAEIDREEQELFTPMPELLGLGAMVPKDGEVKRQDMSSNETLRKQLLGKDYNRRQIKGGKKEGMSRLSAVGMGSKPRPRPLKWGKEDEDEDEEDDGGRSSLGKIKRKRQAEEEAELAGEGAELGVRGSGSVEAAEGRPQRRKNYLDEVLAEKSRAKRKKSKKKAKHINENSS